MTLILGLEHRGRTHLLGDRIVIDGNQGVSLTAAPKVFQLGSWVVGGAGSWRLLALLGRKFRPPRGSDPIEFVDELRAMVTREGIEEQPSDDSPIVWEVLFGRAGSLYFLDSVGGFIPRDTTGIMSCGGDSAYITSRAALIAQRPFKRTAEAHMRRAAQITAELSAECRGPFDYVSA